MKSGLSEFLRAAKELCFPSFCLSCGMRLPRFAELLFCASCAEQIKFIKEPLCTCCGKPFPKAAGGNHLCSACLKHAWHFSKARAVVQYSDPIASVIHAFKYGGATAALSSFKILTSGLPPLDDLGTPDIILPVPLQSSRLRERGFNQALVLARAFFPHLKDRIQASLLERHKWTGPQTSLSGKARRRNLKNAFRVRHADTVKGKRVLLVDDVFTTGTTVNECAGTLRRAGAGDVEVLTLARVQD